MLDQANMARIASRVTPFAASTCRKAEVQKVVMPAQSPSKPGVNALMSRASSIGVLVD
jgi:hypothetical protein